MIVNRYRKLVEEKLAVDAQLFDNVVKCEDIEANEQSESIVTLKASVGWFITVGSRPRESSFASSYKNTASSKTPSCADLRYDGCAPLSLAPVQRIKTQVPFILLEDIFVLQELQHPNIVKLRDHFLVSGKFTLVYESFLTDQNLQQYMAECDGKLASDLVVSYM
eukprot:11533-Heterococcus_DN1.PRE.1